MLITLKPIVVLLALLIFSSVVQAEKGDDSDLVQASLLADADAAVPGKALTLSVRLKMKPHWHTYWINPGESGTPTKVSLTGPAGFIFAAIQWPLPSKLDAPGGYSYGYEDEVLLLIPVTVSKEASIGIDATIKADVSWLSCKDTCIEGDAKLSLVLPIRDVMKPANKELFDAWRNRLPLPKEDATASKALAKLHQTSGRSIAVEWKVAPKKVEWFPVSTRAVAIEDVVVKHEGGKTEIQYKPTVFKPELVLEGRVESILVFEDDAGTRRGITVPIVVSK